MEEKCIICGEIIPEGRQVCQICEYKIMEEQDDVGVFERTEDEISEQD